MQKQDWKNKVNEIFQVCQDEFKRTTEIGKKMISASKTNSTLHETYEEIGSLVVQALKDGDLKWENTRVKELLETINQCEEDLESIEGEVNKIKFASGPVDVSKTESEDKDEKKDDESKGGSAKQ